MTTGLCVHLQKRIMLLKAETSRWSGCNAVSSGNRALSFQFSKTMAGSLYALHY